MTRHTNTDSRWLSFAKIFDWILNLPWSPRLFLALNRKARVVDPTVSSSKGIRYLCAGWNRGGLVGHRFRHSSDRVESFIVECRYGVISSFRSVSHFLMSGIVALLSFLLHEKISVREF